MKKKQPTPKPKYTKEQLDAVDFKLTKNYTWPLDEEFIFTGKEFEVLFSELAALVHKPFSVQSSIKLLALYHLMEAKFKMALVDGKIKEQTKVQPLDTPEIQDFAVTENVPVKETDLVTEA